MTRICLIPNVYGVGGMVSFQAKLRAGLERRGIQVCSDLEDVPYDAVLVTAGTRDLPGLLKARRKGVHVVQRLDGINWLHRRQGSGMRHFLRAETGNLLMAFIRSQLAHTIVYQSEFVRSWWEEWFGKTRRACAVIHNGVDLSVYTPEGAHTRPASSKRVLVVEGSLQGGLTFGLDLALGLCARLRDLGQPALELMVAGKTDEAAQARAAALAGVRVEFTGVVARECIPELDRSAHLLFSAEINAACPNSVIEALACGLPVAAFSNGSLRELVVGDAGRLVPYGADPWKLEQPNLDALARAAAEILADGERFRHAARAHAEAALGLDLMVERYLEVLLGAAG